MHRGSVRVTEDFVEAVLSVPDGMAGVLDAFLDQALRAEPNLAVEAEELQLFLFMTFQGTRVLHRLNRRIEVLLLLLACWRLQLEG